MTSFNKLNILGDILCMKDERCCRRNYSDNFWMDDKTGKGKKREGDSERSHLKREGALNVVGNCTRMST